MRPTVFLIHESPRDDRFDYSKAREFGDIRIVLSSSEKPTRAPIRSLKKIIRVLKEMQPYDYVVSTGSDQVAILLAGVALMYTSLEKITYLRWNRPLDEFGNRLPGHYIPVTIPLRNFSKLKDSSKPSNNN